MGRPTCARLYKALTVPERHWVLFVVLQGAWSQEVIGCGILIVLICRRTTPVSVVIQRLLVVLTQCFSTAASVVGRVCKAYTEDDDPACS